MTRDDLLTALENRKAPTTREHLSKALAAVAKSDADLWALLDELVVEGAHDAADHFERLLRRRDSLRNVWSELLDLQAAPDRLTTIAAKSAVLLGSTLEEYADCVRDGLGYASDDDDDRLGDAIDDDDLRP